MARWTAGELIVRREVLGLDPIDRPQPHPTWYGRCWEALPVYVVEDSPDQLVTYLPAGAEIGFADGAWPTPDGRHPWEPKERWEGHGVLMVQRPGDHHAVWHFWDGPEREFTCWYVNLQTDAVRTPIGYDTQDLELDLVVFPDGSWIVKDLEKLDTRVDEGRFTPALLDWIRTLGDDLVEQLRDGRHWWDHRWSTWTPPVGWRDASLRADWMTAR